MPVGAPNQLPLMYRIVHVGSSLADQDSPQGNPAGLDPPGCALSGCNFQPLLILPTLLTIGSWEPFMAGNVVLTWLPELAGN